MQTEHFTVLNVKCGGCAANIKNGFTELTGVSEIEVNIDSGEVVITGENLDKKQLSAKLSELGYPEA